MTSVFNSVDPESTPGQSRFLWTVAPPLVRGVGRTLFGLSIERDSALPSPPFVVAANHYSHFDSPIVGAALRMPVRFLALEQLLGASTILDWLVEGFGAIPTPRARCPIGAVRTALSALEAGDIVGVFPEATRVSHWGTVPPRPGAAWLALQAGVPLVPVAVLGTGRAFGLDNRLRPARLRVVIGRAMSPDNTGVAELTGRWAKWMTAQIERYPRSETSGPQRVGIG